MPGLFHDASGKVAHEVRHVLDKSWPIGIYVYRDKARHPRARSARGGVVYLAYVPYLGMIYVICVTGMQLCAGETACADPSSSPLPFCRFLCSSETP